MSDLVAVLLRFDETLAALEGVRNDLEGVPAEMRELHEAYGRARQELLQLERDREEAGRLARQAEGKVAEQQEKLRKFQQQITKVRNQREYAAALAEIDQARASLRELEAQALAALERLERATQELEKRRAEFLTLESQHREAMASWEGQKPALRERLDRLEAELAQLRGTLPVPVATQYLRVRERHPRNPLARVEAVEVPGKPTLWHCSACHYQLRPQAAMEIRRREVLVQCESCRRFLYLP